MTDTEIRSWVETIPLTKKVKSLARDFSDAVLMAELIHHFYPKKVDLHNYEQGLKVDTKTYNWNTLNQKVLRPLGMTLEKNVIIDLANSKPGTIEHVLRIFQSITAGRPASTPEQPRKHKTKPTPMTEAERDQFVEKIYESQHQQELIAALQAKIDKMMEIMEIKDARIFKLMEGNHR